MNEGIHLDLDTWIVPGQKMLYSIPVYSTGHHVDKKKIQQHHKRPDIITREIIKCATKKCKTV